MIKKKKIKIKIGQRHIYAFLIINCLAIYILTSININPILQLFLLILPISILLAWLLLKAIDFLRSRMEVELFSGTDIPRKRRFYKKDKQGFYYIPEVCNAKR